MAHTSEESESPGNETVANVEQVDAIRVSTQDFTRILDLLAHLPPPNDRLKAAIAALPESLWQGIKCAEPRSSDQRIAHSLPSRRLPLDADLPLA